MQEQLMNTLREELYKLLEADGRGIPTICEEAGICDSGLYLFLNKTHKNIYANKLLPLIHVLGYEVTFRKRMDANIPTTTQRNSHQTDSQTSTPNQEPRFSDGR